MDFGFVLSLDFFHIRVFDQRDAEQIVGRERRLRHSQVLLLIQR